jgi:dienelactone hydrolase
MKKLYIVIILLITHHVVSAQLKVNFPAKDGLMLTADWYPVNSNFPVILLCHQNNFSRGEFLDIALRLNKFGFNCLALDQRVGGEVNGVPNETALEAKKKNLKPTYEDAEQDIVAAIDYLYTKYNRSIHVLGSSYSASLALKIASEKENVASVIVFSPGEYFTDKKFVADHIQKLTKPVFATSSKSESEGVTDLLKDVNSRIKIQYVPASKGDHGAKVLWPDSQYNQEYWIALMSFLERMKKSK